MSYPNNTNISIYGKSQPDYPLFINIVQKLDFSQIETAFIRPNNENENFNALFRVTFGFEARSYYNNSYIHPTIHKPSTVSLFGLTDKLWSGLDSVGLSFKDESFLHMHVKPYGILDEDEIRSARARKILKMGFQKSKGICYIVTHYTPECLPNESLETMQNIIRALSPSKDYCAEFSTERNHGEPRRKILTLEELSQQLGGYKTQK
jgi:hypothetical protein